MTDTVLVRPWPGLILDGIPRKGAEIPRALAEEWIANHLVVKFELPQVHVEHTPAPAKGSGPTRPIKRRRK